MFSVRDAISEKLAKNAQFVGLSEFRNSDVPRFIFSDSRIPILFRFSDCRILDFEFSERNSRVLGFSESEFSQIVGLSDSRILSSEIFNSRTLGLSDPDSGVNDFLL